MPRGRENAGIAQGGISRDIRFNQAKVMDVHPSRSAVIRLHRMAATNNLNPARGNRTALVGNFLS